MSSTYKKIKILYITTIDTDSIEYIITKILKWNLNSKAEEIRLYIDSEGGDAAGTFALTDVMSNSRIPINTYVLGKAYSAALLIAASGHKRYCYPKSHFMYHDVVTNNFWTQVKYVLGIKNNQTENMKKMSDILWDAIAKCTKLEIDKVKKECRFGREVFLKSNEALDLGIIDEIIQVDQGGVIDQMNDVRQ